MKTIWKFQLTIGEPVAAMPRGAQILTVHEQYGEVCLWALVDPDAPTEDRRFHIVGTGHPSAHLKNYIGTAQVAGGALVWHVFETT